MARLAVTFVVIFALFALSDARPLGKRFAAPESTAESMRDSQKSTSPTTITVPVGRIFDVSSSSDDTLRRIGFSLRLPFPDRQSGHFDRFHGHGHAGRHHHHHHHHHDVREMEIPLGEHVFRFSGRIPIEPKMPAKREEGSFVKRFRDLVNHF